MTIKILMPALSPTMTEGNIAKWHKKEGDTVEAGDIIVEIETDKATMEVESIDEGVMGKIFIADGTENVKVNTLIAALLEEGEDASALEGIEAASAPAETSAEPSKDAPAQEDASTTAAPTEAATASVDNSAVFASPLARRLANEKGLNLAQISGTGPNGRIVKKDVLAAKSGGGAGGFSAGAAIPTFQRDVQGFPPYKEVKNNNMRKIIARRLTESKQTVPHFYLTIDCVLDNLLETRKHLNEAADGAYKLSVNDFIIKASALALKAVPEANVSWTDDAIRHYETADISVAVAIEGGLITPVIQSAEYKSLPAVSSEVKALAAKARDGKLQPEEYQGGTFTISNLGMFGIKEFSAIVNPPQAAILAVGKGAPRPVVQNGVVAISTVMTCTLSIDHRAIDGSVGAAFLDKFKSYIEKPVTMLV
ncbi:MAG: pyruvate dehydrogenase complex dihydrolipoamide acetyltransferase [Alphaproteobacteria bacterium]